jgi:hypothetical protein
MFDCLFQQADLGEFDGTAVSESQKASLICIASLQGSAPAADLKTPGNHASKKQTAFRLLKVFHLEVQRCHNSSVGELLSREGGRTSWPLVRKQ